MSFKHFFFLPACLFIMATGLWAQTQSGMVAIPGGTFIMGSPVNQQDRRDNEGPQHSVTVSAFYMGAYEVTQAEWMAVMGSNPSEFKGDKQPVEQVSWYDILVYCNQRSIKEGLTPCYSIKNSTDPGKWGLVPTTDDAAWNAAGCSFAANGYRMPTEAEWEYACRAGTTAATAFGTSLSSTQANFNGYIPYNGAAGGANLVKTSAVGSYKANAFGLFDMHGNVFETCWDWYGSYNAGAQKNPEGARSGTERVCRGGCWGDGGDCIQSSRRAYANPLLTDSGVGFRLVRSGKGW